MWDRPTDSILDAPIILFARITAYGSRRHSDTTEYSPRPSRTSLGVHVRAAQERRLDPERPRSVETDRCRAAFCGRSASATINSDNKIASSKRRVPVGHSGRCNWPRRPSASAAHPQSLYDCLTSLKGLKPSAELSENDLRKPVDAQRPDRHANHPAKR